MGYSFTWILNHLRASGSVESASYAATASYVNLLAGPNITINYLPNGAGIAISGSDAPGYLIWTRSFGDNNAVLKDTQQNISYADQQSSIAYGYQTSASADFSQAQGYRSRTVGSYAHAEGWNTFAYANSSHTEGNLTRTYGPFSHAEGYQTLTATDDPTRAIPFIVDTIDLNENVSIIPTAPPIPAGTSAIFTTNPQWVAAFTNGYNVVPFTQGTYGAPPQNYYTATGATDITVAPVAV